MRSKKIAGFLAISIISASLAGCTARPPQTQVTSIPPTVSSSSLTPVAQSIPPPKFGDTIQEVTSISGYYTAAAGLTKEGGIIVGLMPRDDLYNRPQKFNTALATFDRTGRISNFQILPETTLGTSTCEPSYVTVNSDGAIAVPTFTMHASEGLKKASYDVSLVTYNTTLKESSQVFIAKGIEGTPECQHHSTEKHYFDLDGDVDPSRDRKISKPFTNAMEHRWEFYASADGSWVATTRADPKDPSKPAFSLVHPSTKEVKTFPFKPLGVKGNNIVYNCSKTAQESKTCVGTWEKIDRIMWDESSTAATKTKVGIFSPYSPINDSDIFLANLSSNNSSGNSVAALVSTKDFTSYTPIKATNYTKEAAVDNINKIVAVQGGDNQKKLILGASFTGSEIWRIEASHICGMSKNGFIVMTDDSVVLVDSKTGKQLAYNKPATKPSSCPLTFPTLTFGIEDYAEPTEGQTRTVSLNT